MTEYREEIETLPFALRRLEAITNMLPNELDEDRRLDTTVFERRVLERMDHLNQFAMYEGTQTTQQLKNPDLSIIQVDRLHSIFLPPEGIHELYMAHHIARHHIEYVEDAIKAPRALTTIQTIKEGHMRIWYVRKEESLYYHNHQAGELYPCAPHQLSNLDRLIDLMEDQSYLLQLI